MRIELKDNAAPELYIYDEIGPTWAGMISGETVVDALAEIGNVPEIVVRINSVGGDVFQGIAIYNALVRHPARITVEIDSLAASAASLVAMAGNTIRMAPTSMQMVHNAWTILAGNKDELRAMASTLEKVDGNLAETYAARSGLASDEITALLDAETWLTAQEAIDKGLADEIGQPLAVSAKVRPGRYRNTPTQFLGDKPEQTRIETPAAPPRRYAARLAELSNLNARRRSLAAA